MKRVYLDNAATTQADDAVVKAMMPYFSKHYGNASSIHLFGESAKDALDEARRTIAKELNADEKEIIFTSGGTESDNLAIRGIAYANAARGKHIITSKIEHHAVLNTCAALEKEGFAVTYLDVDKDGIIDMKQLERAITDKTVLVSVMHANNEIGVIQPIERIGEIAIQNQVHFHTDAVQSFTKEKIDVKRINVDLISMSAHKIHGPKGVGALYVRRGVNLKRLSEGGHHEFNRRPGTENVPAIVGFAKAVELSRKENKRKIAELRDYLVRSILSKVPDAKYNGHQRSRLANNASISFKFIEGESLLLHLSERGIAVSTGSACTSDSLEPSHVLLAIGIPHETAHGTIRFTLSRHTTKKEIDYLIKTIVPIIRTLREMSPLTNSKKKYDEIVHVHH